MSAGTLTADPAPAVPSVPSVRPTRTPAEVWRRARPIVIVGLIVTFGGLAIALLTGASSALAYDPSSPAPGGSRAIARLLHDRGVTVLRGNELRLDRLRSAGASRATVLVPDAARLSDADLAGLPELTATTDVIAVVRDTRTLAAIGLSGRVRHTDATTTDPGCDLPASVTAGRARVSGTAYRLGQRQPLGLHPTATCYAGSLVRLSASGAGSLTLLGSGRFLRNDQLAHEGDAALALGLLGGRPTVEWVLPAAGQGSTSGGSGTEALARLLPRRLLFFGGELLVVVALLALWRARRLGPVVRESLPVVVPAAETVRGRARLYRTSGARDRAARSLQEAARSRLARRFGLGVDTTPPQLVAAVAARAGRTDAEIASLLYGDVRPEADDDLVRFAGELDLLQDRMSREGPG